VFEPARICVPTDKINVDEAIMSYGHVPNLWHPNRSLLVYSAKLMSHLLHPCLETWMNHENSLTRVEFRLRSCIIQRGNASPIECPNQWTLGW